MDAPTRGCAEYVFEHYGNNLHDLNIFIKSKIDEHRNFLSALNMKYNEPVTGFIFHIGNTSALELRQNEFMTMLLASIVDHSDKNDFN